MGYTVNIAAMNFANFVTELRDIALFAQMGPLATYASLTAVQTAYLMRTKQWHVPDTRGTVPQELANLATLTERALYHVVPIVRNQIVLYLVSSFAKLRMELAFLAAKSVTGDLLAIRSVVHNAETTIVKIISISAKTVAWIHSMDQTAIKYATTHALITFVMIPLVTARMDV